MAKNSEASLLIRIKEAGAEALGKIRDNLEEIGAKAAAVSAIITGFLGLSLKGFAEAEESSNALTQSLINQGLDVETLKKQYDDLAAAIMKKSRYDDDAITAAIRSSPRAAGVGLSFAVFRASAAQ